MTDHNQKVEPARFDVSPATTATPASADDTSPKATAGEPSARPGWVVPALLALSLLAILVFFWLPNRVQSPSIDAQDVANRSAPRPQVTEISPWSDAQLAKQRKAAQDVLGLLLDEQFALEEAGAEVWAEQAFAAAKEQAGAADELYRQQQFLEAGEAYQQGLDSMRAISATSESVFDALRVEGMEALATRRSDIAIEAFETALLIKPENEAIQNALRRAGNLDQVLALLQLASEARASGNRDEAAQILEEARRIDPENGEVLTELQLVQREITRSRFNAAMTEGYQALDQEKFDAAEAAFLRARKIMPASVETESALLQARTGRTLQRIAALRSEADAAAGREEWDKARQEYQKILDIDDSVVFARVGLIESRERAAIDARLQKAIAEPQRLGDEAIYQQARQLYRDASGLQQQGPRLQSQLRQLGEVLRYAQEPVRIALVSDEKTEVTVYKVARLGTFAQHVLELKPGTYTAVGVRPGYRDVRQVFTVTHQQPPGEIAIICSEPI